jgi:hypothetical protein
MINSDSNIDRSPRFVIEFDTKTGKIKVDKNQYIYPKPLEIVSGELTLFVLGSPIIDYRVNKTHIANDILNKSFIDEGYIKCLDGEFLLILINRKSKKIEVANDRFSSFTLYYYVNNGKVVLSHAYIDILERISIFESLRIKEDVIFEYLWFRRVFDNRTYDNYSKFLKPASLISIGYDGISRTNYWRPTYVKNNNSLESNSQILKDLLVSALEKKTSDIKDEKIGLFLSGGMDTRTILSLFDNIDHLKPPHCFTIGYSESGEYRVAKKLTEALNSPHEFIKLKENFYDISWNEKLNMTGGMHNQYTILFSGYSKKMSENADIFFHGHALDYMFQGMYLPTEQYKVFGKKTYFKKIVNVNKVGDFSEYFMKNIPFRTWKVQVEDYLLPKYKNNMIAGLKDKINSIVLKGQEVCNDNYDLWEYLMTHTPSRHYSQPDITGMGANGEQRKIANDNALFDFYTSLPLQHRLYARVMRGALQNLSPKFSNIISANTGYKINAGPFALTNYFARLKLFRMVTGNSKYRHPQAKDRTWPDLDCEVRIRPRLRKSIMNLPKSEPLRSAMPFFDFDKLEKDIDLWINHDKPGGGLFLTSILTLDNLVRKFQ